MKPKGKKMPPCRRQPEITPAMIDAGLERYLELRGITNSKSLIVSVYLAICMAAEASKKKRPVR